MDSEILRMERQRRLAAWKAVSPLSNEDAKVLLGLPVLLRTQGLLAGLVQAGKSSPRLASAIVGWLATRPGSRIRATATTRRDFIEAFVELDPDDAMATEHEALRFAEALKVVYQARGEG